MPDQDWLRGLQPGDMSHAMLIAVLMDAGGSIDLPLAAFERDALGGPDGSHHAVEMRPHTDGTHVRLSVRPRPAGDEGGVTRE